LEKLHFQSFASSEVTWKKPGGTECRVRQANLMKLRFLEFKKNSIEICAKADDFCCFGV